MGERELTREERAAIRSLVVSLCANYDSNYGCLPLECSCYMLGKWWTGSYCRYFENAVLPNDLKLMASLLGSAAPVIKTRTCSVCGKSFPASGKGTYCSAACKREGNRRKSRVRMQKKRADNSSAKCYDLLR